MSRESFFALVKRRGDEIESDEEKFEAVDE